MRAAIFQGRGEALTVGEVAPPVCGRDEMVIAVRSCGICGSDLHLADAHPAESGMSPLPSGSVMGHEFAGEVVEVGAGVSGFRSGDRVTAMPYVACGRCAACLAGVGYRCAEVRYTGLGARSGGYAEFVGVGAAESLRLPAGIDFERGALVEPLAVALHAVNAARLRPAESVLIMGAGPIGLAATLWARYFGAQHVIVSDRVPERLALAAALGAHEVIDATSTDVIQSYKRYTGRRPDVVFECVGVPGTQQLAMDYAPMGGRLVIVGVCMAPDTIRPVKALTKELQVNYVFMYHKQDFELAIDLLDRELLDPSPMLTRTVSFSEFPQAFESLKTDKTACKVILRPDL